MELQFLEIRLKIYLLTQQIQIYQHEPLTENIVKKINPNISLFEIKEEVEEIGYCYVNDNDVLLNPDKQITEKTHYVAA